MFFDRSIVGATALCIGLASGANAASLDAAAIMNGIVSISLGDMTATATTHVEGPAYIGGSYTQGGTFDANGDNMPEVTLNGVTGSLFVGGDLTTDINSAQNGAVQVGGTFTGNTNGETVNAGVAGIPVAEMKTLFETLSSTIEDITDTAGASVSGDTNNVTYTSGAGDVDGIAYLTLSAADVTTFLNSQANATFNLASGVSLIINVPGEIFSGATEVLGKVNNDSPNVLFNFFEATTLDFGSNPFNASILAPFANVHTAGGGTNGTIVGATIDLGGEVRPYGNVNGYAGGLPTAAVAAAVPLPAGIFLLGGALAGLGVTRRIKSRA